MHRGRSCCRMQRRLARCMCVFAREREREREGRPDRGYNRLPDLYTATDSRERRVPPLFNRVRRESRFLSRALSLSLSCCACLPLPLVVSARHQFYRFVRNKRDGEGKTEGKSMINKTSGGLAGNGFYLTSERAPRV